jgi:heme exporter protein C
MNVSFSAKQLAVDSVLLILVTAWIAWIIGGGLGIYFPVPTFSGGEELVRWIEFGVPPAQEAAGGWAQKIFYFHVPAATVGFVGFLLVAAASLGVLIDDSRYWDRRVKSCVEVSFVFATVVLLTGPFWAKPVWGIWWRWEPRMTTFFVLWVMYGGWFLLRGTLPAGEQRRIYSAIYALLAFLNVPVVMLSVYFWKPEQQLHPQSIALEPVMQYTLYASFVMMFILLVRFLLLRFGIELLERDVEELRP